MCVVPSNREERFYSLSNDGDVLLPNLLPK